MNWDQGKQGSCAVNRPIPESVLALLKEIGSADSREFSSEVVRYGAFVGSDIRCFPTLPRAMNFSRDLIDNAAREKRAVASGTTILADTMTQCKGRFTRSWHAPQGGVWGCMIHAETLLPQSRAFIPLAVGVACCETLQSFGLPAVIRWVNDVLVGGRKIAGFLVETYTERLFGEEFSLVGFGINVNNCDFPDELEGTATSMRQLLGTDTNLTQLSSVFLARLAWNFGLLHFEEQFRLNNEAWAGKNGLHSILARWSELTDSCNRRVVYGFDVMEAPQYQAHLLGIDEYGGIQLQLDDGYVKTEYSGEIRYLD